MSESKCILHGKTLAFCVDCREQFDYVTRKNDEYDKRKMSAPMANETHVPSEEVRKLAEELAEDLENDLRAIIDLDASFDRAPIADAHILALRALEKLRLLFFALQAHGERVRREALEEAAQYVRVIPLYNGLGDSCEGGIAAGIRALGEQK